MPRLIAALLVLSSYAAFGQRPPNGPPAPWLDPDRSEPAGTHYATFASRLAGGDVSYLVYLPPDYETATDRRFPVIYWLHGLGGNQRRGEKFVEHLNIAIRTNKAPSMIVVLVNGLRDGWYNDSPDGKWPLESVIIKELIPHVDQTYRTIARRNGRGVEGFSMGGYGAAHLGFKYPDLFGTVGIMAGALIGANGIGGMQGKMNGAAEMLRDNDPAVLVEKNAEAIRGKTAIRIAVGAVDNLQTRDQEFHELLKKLKIDHEYEVIPGVAHNIPAFYDALGERAFGYYRKAFNFGARSGRPPGAMGETNTAQSRVLQRGDLEILTFETEQDYDRLQELYKQSQDAKPEPGGKLIRYYRSRTDGSVQPYAISFPRDYNRGRSYPLVVQLHGLNFKEVLTQARLRYGGMPGPQWMDPELPVIYVQCFGRPSTFYQGIGEEEVLEVIDDAKQRYSVDPERVYIMGHSMGGAGSFTVGMHYPDRFGGITPTDAALWSGGAEMPDWMKPQFAIQAVPNLYPNARNVPVFFKHAGAGIQGRSFEFADGIIAEGGFSTMESFPGMPHGFAQFYAYRTFISQLTEHPIRRKPAEVKYYTNTLRYNGAYWVTIDHLAQHNADARVTATCGQDALRVTTTNIDGLTLRVGDSPAKGASIPLVVDGREVKTGPLPDTVHLTKTGGQWTVGERPSSGLAKRHGVQGPIGDVFNSRFLAVYGEGDRDLATAELDAVRNPPGPMDIHGDFPMKAAAKVTREDVASSNLILFGTPATNAVLKRIAGQLPADLLQGSGVFIYPNPENPSRYVVVWNAKVLSTPDPRLRVNWVMPVNLLPDYVRFENGRIASAGHFDNEWKVR